MIELSGWRRFDLTFAESNGVVPAPLPSLV